MPKITVLMPVYNGEKYLKEAIKSILNQTFSDFEFLIINDGSTDSSVNIIESYKDKRIRLIHNNTNLGLVDTLNKGFNLSNGEYIARMDCDDICLPRRLETQTDFLNHNPDIGVCGTFVKKIGIVNFVNRYYIKSDYIKAAFLFNTNLAHPTVMMRKLILQKNNLKFNSEFIHAEDYDFWTRAMDFTEFANIPKVLLHYRVHNYAISQTYKDIQRKNKNKIKLKLLENLGISPSFEEIKSHNLLILGDNELNKSIDRTENWYKKILEANKKSRIYEDSALHKIISDRWLLLNYLNCKKYSRTFKKYLYSTLRNRLKDENKKILIQFISKSLKSNFLY